MKLSLLFWNVQGVMIPNGKEFDRAPWLHTLVHML
jgi:hypothetical protein